jgi:hypothetical protein
MTRLVAFGSLFIALCAVKSFGECGEETIVQVMQHGAVIRTGDTFEAATRGVARQEHAQLALRTASAGPAVLQVRYSATPVVTGTPNAIGTTYSFGANDKHMEVTSYTTSRTDYRQLGLLAAVTGPTLLGRFANGGFAATPGDFFTATNSAHANTFTTASTDATGVRMELVYTGHVYDTAIRYQYRGDRTPDCSGGNLCNMKENTMSVSDANAASTSCVDSGMTTTMSTLNTEIAVENSFSPLPASGTTKIYCLRMQDTSSATAIPGIYSRWIKYMSSGTGGGTLSYAYEDTITRCAKK